MKTFRPIYAVYSPPTLGLPFLSVILAEDGTVTARPFDTGEQAAAFNKRVAEVEIEAEHGAKIGR